MQPHIREASDTDYEGLCALFAEVDALHQAHLPETFKKPDGAGRPRAFVQHLLTEEAVGFFVAETADRIVGVIHLEIKTPPDLPILVQRPYALIDNLVVAEAARRSGVGRALMAHAQAWAVAQGAESVVLHVWDFNEEAAAFYRALGYVTLSQKMGKRLR